MKKCVKLVISKNL